MRYGDGKDYVRFDVCPGSRWAAEIDEVSGFVDGRPYIAAGRRHIESLAIEDEQRLVPFELPEPDEPFAADVVSCRDATAGDMFVFGEHPGREDDLVLRLKDGVLTEAWKGQAAAIAFADGRDVAYLATGKAGDENEVVEVDLETGEERPVVTLPGRVLGLSLQPGGSLLTGTYGTGEVRMPNRTFVASLFTVESSGGDPETVEAGEGGSATWLSKDRIGFSRWEGGLDIYDADLLKITSKPGWKSTPVGADGYIYGAWDDAVHYSRLDDGPIEKLSEVRLTIGQLAILSSPRPQPAAASAEPELTRSDGLRPGVAVAAGLFVVGSVAGIAWMRRRPSTR